MIVSASRRTDIPAYYGEWLVNRLRAGEVLTRNPMNHAQVTRLTLSPETTDCIIFWTKNPEPFLRQLSVIDAMGYRYCFQFTLDAYGSDLERKLPPKAQIVETFKRLSNRIGRDRVLWRYDPVILNKDWTLERHEECFTRLCEQLSPYTRQMTFSFVQRYQKLRDPNILDISDEDKLACAAMLGRVSRQFGLIPRACCVPLDLTACGIRPAACIDQTLLEQIFDIQLRLKPDRSQRTGCGCYESVDIGAYDTCPHGCTYCYANSRPTLTDRNFREHDPRSPLLSGEYDPGRVTDRPCASNLFVTTYEQLSW